VVFNWIIDNENVYDSILNNISDLEYQSLKITLTCDEKSLEDRWYNDKINEWRIKKWLDIR
jgi:hypothetical protein